MGGYIGAKTGTLVASASDIRGDISATDATPEITLKNTTETDADGTRSGKITFKGEQSGGEESVLAQIQGSHDGTADDEKGDLIFKTNDGSDGASPTERLRISSDSTFTFASDDAGAGIGPNLVYYRNSSSPADNDLLAEIDHRGRNDNSQDVDYATVNIFAEDVSDGTEDGKYLLQTIKAGATVSRMDLNSTETVFNDDSKDIDFRVESDDSTHAFNVDGQHSTVGINTAAVSNRTLKIEGEGNVGAGVSLSESTRGGYVEFLAGSGTELYVGSELAILGSGSNDEFTIYVGQQAIKINRNGQVTLPQMPAFAATRSQGHVAASTDYVYPNVYFNRGNDYDSSNGRFTAPVAGMYSVHVNHMDISSVTYTNTYYDIRKNGSTYQLVYSSNPTSASHHRWSWSGIVEMAANDYLNINTGNMSLYGGGNEYTNFSAALLG